MSNHPAPAHAPESTGPSYLTIEVNGVSYRTESRALRGMLGGQRVDVQWDGKTDLIVRLDTREPVETPPVVFGDLGIVHIPLSTDERAEAEAYVRRDLRRLSDLPGETARMVECFIVGRRSALQVGVGRDGIDLLAEAGRLFREYEEHHRERVSEAKSLDQRDQLDQPGGTTNEWKRQAASSLEKAERNAEIAARIEAHLETPVQPTESALMCAAVGAMDDWLELTTQSEGVYGLHQNGDPAPWPELLAGGRFEEWTAGLERLRVLLNPPGPGTCRVCGCTDDHACDPPCGWVDESRTLCDNLDCRLKAEAMDPEPSSGCDVVEVPTDADLILSHIERQPVPGVYRPDQVPEAVEDQRLRRYGPVRIPPNAAGRVFIGKLGRGYTLDGAGCPVYTGDMGQGSREQAQRGEAPVPASGPCGHYPDGEQPS